MLRERQIMWGLGTSHAEKDEDRGGRCAGCVHRPEYQGREATNGLTQSKLAEALAIENVTVSRIETGAQLPSIDRLDDIARLLNVLLPMLLRFRNTRFLSP
jgi:DNA-binding XRE family transcriptional regulator